MKALKEVSGRYAIIILAAGRSARLGSPKQLLSYRGKNLLQHSIDTAFESKTGPVLVVLGSEIQAIEAKLQRTNLRIVENPEWESGMASSIRYGLNTLQCHYPDTEAVILMVCDQPFVNTKLLNDLIDKYEESGSNIVASSYENINGTPALFHKTYFRELAALKGDIGARFLIKKYAKSLQTIPFLKGSIDIDTMENYRNLLK